MLFMVLLSLILSGISLGLDVDVNPAQIVDDVARLVACYVVREEIVQELTAAEVSQHIRFTRLNYRWRGPLQLKDYGVTHDGCHVLVEGPWSGVYDAPFAHRDTDADETRATRFPLGGVVVAGAESGATIAEVIASTTEEFMTAATRGSPDLMQLICMAVTDGAATPRVKKNGLFGGAGGCSEPDKEVLKRDTLTVIRSPRCRLKKSILEPNNERRRLQ